MSQKKRCDWAETQNQLMVSYHDTEWGVPVSDDRILFEFIVLESAQAGLSWQTILNKREGYRRIFKNFDPKKVAKMTSGELKKALQDPAIVRNRLKVAATVQNAKSFIKIQKEFGSFAAYMWSFIDSIPIQGVRKKQSDVPAVTDLAVQMAKDLKKRGFAFLGPTVWYAHMQAVGMVNDHTIKCFRHKEVKALQKSLKKKLGTTTQKR